jgi:NAD+ synthase (glutamine-hydrolysing)
MPGFGTTERTQDNAVLLAEALGVTLRTIPIADAVRQHFRDIGHDESLHNVTYENAQARERTQILMDVANQVGGLVVGTGDLSELALGWLTYSGDHMSMYHVNAGVPKTLVRYLIEWVADEEWSGRRAAAVLRDIIATPITPELLPLSADGAWSRRPRTLSAPTSCTISSSTRWCASSSRRPRSSSWPARPSRESIRRRRSCAGWRLFYRRFFSQQFKRSAMPDGPKVGSVALSPRGDWRMPSDASAAVWLDELAAIAEQIGAL